MFAVLDYKTLKIVGTSRAVDLTDGRVYVPIEKALYVDFMEHPSLQRLFVGKMGEDNVVRLIDVPEVTQSECGVVHLEDLKGSEDYHFLITIEATHVLLHAQTRDEVELVSLYKGTPHVLFHRVLRHEDRVEHSITNLQHAKWFVSHPILEYTYRVKHA